MNCFNSSKQRTMYVLTFWKTSRDALKYNSTMQSVSYQLAFLRGWRLKLWPPVKTLGSRWNMSLTYKWQDVGIGVHTNYTVHRGVKGLLTDYTTLQYSLLWLLISIGLNNLLPPNYFSWWLPRRINEKIKLTSQIVTSYFCGKAWKMTSLKWPSSEEL